MAKALNSTPPRSSVERLFDKNSVARALEPPCLRSIHRGSAGEEAMPASVPVLDSSIVKREFVLTRSTDRTLTQLVQAYREATGTRLSNSHVIRAVLRGIAVGLPAIKIEAARHGPLKLPSNARGYEAERDQFEQTLVSSFLAGMRSLPSYRPVTVTNSVPVMQESRKAME